MSGFFSKPDLDGIDPEAFKKSLEESLKRIMEEYSDRFVQELTIEEAEDVHKMNGGLTRNMGNKLYKLPGGVITGPGGLELMNKVFKEEFIKRGFTTPKEKIKYNKQKKSKFIP